MDYIIVIPAYDEEERIGKVLESLVRQTLLPREVMVVDDGSTDRTAEIVAGFARDKPWIKLCKNSRREERAAGAKVVRAFNLGYGQITQPHEFLVKLDADIELPSNYFEEIAGMFQADPRLGIAGGQIYMQHKGAWVREVFADPDHVVGAFKAWRKACFEQIGGLRASIGWDAADELLARYYGWHILTHPKLPVYHHRKLGTETGNIEIRRRIGWGLFRLRYGFWISLFSSLKSAFRDKPYLISGVAMILGWLEAKFRGDKYIVNRDQGAFIRSFRWERMKGKMIALGRRKDS
jgi:glycosyltransferase involved in cell wall biosynthesis